MGSGAEDVSGLADRPTRRDAVPILRFEAADADTVFDAWRDLAAVLFDCVPRISHSGTFDASLTVRHFGTFLLCTSFVGSGRYLRNSFRLTRDDLDHIVISCVTGGGIALAGPRRLRLRPGDVTVFDLSSPAFFSMTSAEALHLIVPRIALPVSAASTSPAPPRIFSRKTAMGIFIRGMIESLSQAAQSLNQSEAMAFGAAVPEMLGWCLGMTGVPLTEGKGDLSRRLRRHIEQNLHRTDLTSSRLSREVGVSRSQLYRQFETSGGVDTYIRQRRLRRSLMALGDPRHADRRIGDIAYDMGFADEAHFSRLFRRAFGRSPRDTRNGMRQGHSFSLDHLLSPEGGNNTFAEWLSTLGVR